MKNYTLNISFRNNENIFPRYFIPKYSPNATKTKRVNQIQASYVQQEYFNNPLLSQMEQLIVYADPSPPNGWRCRCNVVQVRVNRYPISDSATANDLGNKATYTIGANGKNTAEMFRFNPGKQETIFPAHHPYLKDKEVTKKLNE